MKMMTIQQKYVKTMKKDNPKRRYKEPAPVKRFKVQEYDNRNYDGSDESDQYE